MRSLLLLLLALLAGCASAGFFDAPGCAKGHYAAADGSCAPCPAGTANARTGASSPSACVPCKPGFYAASAGASMCRSCGAYASSFSAGATTCVCDETKAPGYTLFRDINVGLAECCNHDTCASSGGLARL